MNKIKHVVFLFLTALAISVSAKTVNPIEMVVEGGYPNFGPQTTQLFLDREIERRSRFWVRVIDSQNQSDDIVIAPTVDGGVPAAEVVTTYIKYFPVRRWREVKRAVNNIRNFGVVDRAPSGAFICDGPDTTIRKSIEKFVTIIYNCSSTGQQADNATFEAERLLNALRSETINDADVVWESSN